MHSSKYINVDTKEITVINPFSEQRLYITLYYELDFSTILSVWWISVEFTPYSVHLSAALFDLHDLMQLNNEICIIRWIVSFKLVKCYLWKTL